MKRLLISLFFIYIMTCAVSSALAQNASENNINLKDQGIIFYKDYKYQEALNCFERIDKRLLNTEILILMSNCYSSLNYAKKASELLIRAIETDSGNPFPYYNLGILHYQNNNLYLAINNFNRAVSLNKNFAAAYYNLGVCYYLINNFKKAKDSFIAALNLNPDNPDITYSLVLTYAALKDKSTAKKYLDIYSKISGKESAINTNSINTVAVNKKHTQRKKHSAKKLRRVRRIHRIHKI